MTYGFTINEKEADRQNTQLIFDALEAIEDASKVRLGLRKARNGNQTFNVYVNNLGYITLISCKKFNQLCDAAGIGRYKIQYINDTWVVPQIWTDMIKGQID